MVDSTKFAIGILFALVGSGMLFFARGERGFGQRKQAGSLLLVGAVVFVSVGVGWLDV